MYQVYDCPMCGKKESCWGDNFCGKCEALWRQPELPLPNAWPGHTPECECQECFENHYRWLVSQGRTDEAVAFLNQ